MPDSSTATCCSHQAQPWLPSTPRDEMSPLRIAILPAVCLGLLCPSGPLPAQEIKVTLLGTGCPGPVMNRFGASTLVQAGGQSLLFDAGRGALQRLTQIGVR